MSVPGELEHHYGSRVHLLQSAALSTWLADLCHPETFQPQINLLVEKLYRSLVQVVLEREFPKVQSRQPTRMTGAHPACFLECETLKKQTRAVTVNLARAGTFPSQICFDTLNTLLDPRGVRQDHILASRLTDESQHVTGTQLGASKIGGDVDDAIVLFPDPMGATGNTIIEAIEHYKKSVGGTAKQFVALHLIITPEYLKNVLAAHPDVTIYAVRVDRGLSPAEVLRSAPGLHWDREQGLNQYHYIVPGGGGLGEIMNNSFV